MLCNISGKLCDHPKINQMGAFDLFPVEQPVEREMHISTEPSAVVAQAVAITGDNTRKFVGFYVVGCVSYRFSFGPNVHQTRFAYHLNGPGGRFPDGRLMALPGGMLLISGFEVGVNVPKEQLGMTQELFAFNDAN